MGRDKGLIEWKGQSLAEHAIRALQEICTYIMISANSMKYKQFGYPVVRDHIQDSGPLAGIHAALRMARTRKSIVRAVDTPLVNASLYRYLLKNGREADVIVAKDDRNRFEPLCAIYSRSMLSAIEEQISLGIYGFTPLFEKVDCCTVPIDPTGHFHEPLLFLNINTPADLETLQKMP
jgi:molybdopterin-guanine dinucleotide biosynthesis protein A